MRLSPVFVAATLLMAGPGLGSAFAACAQAQGGQAAVGQPAHDAAAHDQASPAKEHDHAAMLAAQAAAEPDEIDVLLAKMHKAKGQAKVALMADLLTKLVAERKAGGANHAQAAPSAAPDGGHEAGGGHGMSCPMCAEKMKAGAHK